MFIRANFNRKSQLSHCNNHRNSVFIGSLWSYCIKMVLACFGCSRQTCKTTWLVGVDLYCHSLCHCLCGQMHNLVLFLLAQYYNTVNASSDLWKLPSIHMNHIDGLCNPTELPIFQTAGKYDSSHVTPYQKKSDVNPAISQCNVCSVTEVLEILWRGSLFYQPELCWFYTASIYTTANTLSVFIKKWFHWTCMIHQHHTSWHPVP